ncbi:gliding motility lipoprotein GldH [Leptobacterium sp. I13]|uniref:gliding motility lipoprotein GldH n=1 Tax=Leptobacterium meishanense TaxID=3128904 RepID=UPI0030EF8901
MLKKGLFLFLLILFHSCNTNTVFSEYQSIEKGWNKNKKITFSFQAPDTIGNYDMFINLRNDENYKYNNLFLIVEMRFPNSEVISDTLEYEMAKSSGEWLGKGFTSLKESKLWYKEAVTFPISGEYEVHIEHAMRSNGSIEGVSVLEGINDVGIEIEKVIKN